MRTTHLIFALSCLLVLLGGIVVTGWYLHAPTLIRLFVNLEGMSPTAGLGFLLVGIALLVTALQVRLSDTHEKQRDGRTQRLLAKLLIGCASALLLLGTGVLAEWVFGIRLGFSPEPVALREWLVEEFPHQGRMRPLTALGFIMLGLGFYLHPKTTSKWVLLLTPILTLFVIFIGLLGFIGQLLGIGAIIPTLIGPAFTSGIGFVLSGGGLLIVQSSLGPYRQTWYQNESQRITLIATFIVVSTGMMGIIGGFGVLYQQMVEELESNLEISLKYRSNALQTGVHEAMRDGLYFADHTASLLPPLSPDGYTSNAHAAALQQVVERYREYSFSGALIRTPQGEVLARQGRFITDTDAKVTLNTPLPSVLMWHDGFVLHLFIPLVVSNKVIATLETERPLPMENALEDISYFGQSLDFPVCAPHGAVFRCFPFRSAGWKFMPELPATRHGEKVSLAYGLKGNSGIIRTIDYRGVQVIAAFGPVGDLGLVANLEVDAGEFHRRIAQRLWPLFIMLLLITAAAVFLLRLQVVPLVRRMTSEIQERRKAEANLQESESRLAEITATLGEGVYVVDEQGVFTFVNPEAERLMGWSSADLLGKRASEVLSCSVCPISQTLLTGQSYSSSDVQFMHKNGSLVPVSATSNPILRNGTLKGCVTSFQDITEKKRAEAELCNYKEHLEQLVEERTDELHKLNYELEAFNYSVSHDLRAPLRSLKGFSGALQEDFGHLLPAQALNYLERISKASTHMGKLIEGLLNLSQVARSELQFDTVNLTEMAKRIAASLKEAEPARSVTFSIQDGLLVRGDARLMEALLENLLGNAWKFTSSTPDAHIEFGRRPDEQEPVFYVHDNGPGFDMQFADKLFQPFQRLHSQEEFPGSGIGLATVQRIVERHGGRVWAESHHDRGATLFFSLPAPR